MEVLVESVLYTGNVGLKAEVSIGDEFAKFDADAVLRGGRAGALRLLGVVVEVADRV